MEKEIKEVEREEVKEEMKLDWMYNSATVDREDYLLGRSVDKAFSQLEQSSGSKAEVDRESIPSTIFTNSCVTTQVDIARKVHEDPLFAIKKKEMETREQFLKNPRMLKQLHEMIEKQKIAQERKQKKKMEKHKNGEDLDLLLALKYKRLKDKLSLKDLKELESSDSEDSEHYSERSREKLKKKRSQTASSDTESENDDSNLKRKKDKYKRQKSIKYKKKKIEDKSNSTSNSSTDSDQRSKNHNKKEKRSSHSLNKKQKIKIEETTFSRRNSSVYRNENNKYLIENKSSSLSDSFKAEKYLNNHKSYNTDHLRRRENRNNKNKSNHEGTIDFRRKCKQFNSSDDERSKFSSRNLKYLRKPNKKRTQEKSSSSRTSESEDEYTNKDKYKHKNKYLMEKRRDLKKNNVSDSDTDKKIFKKKRKYSSYEDDETNVSKINVKSKGIKKEQESESTSNSDSENENTKKKAYGLVLPAGYVPKPQTEHKKIQPKVEDTKPWRRSKSTKLTEEEMEKRVSEMMQNAKWREKEREKKISDYKAKEAREKTEDSKYSSDFLRKQMLYAASQSTVEQRIKSNINNIQRNRSDMDKNFARR